MKHAIAFSVFLVAAPAMAAEPQPDYLLSGVVFDDGGEAVGGFDFHPVFWPPQFFDFTIVTSAGAVEPGSTFTASTYCWNNHKLDTCAPGADLLIQISTGIPNQAGYDMFQFAGWYAPNDTRTVVLDKAVSYEEFCPAAGSCVIRHVVSGAFTLN
jgi:hypothetical protein